LSWVAFQILLLTTDIWQSYKLDLVLWHDTFIWCNVHLSSLLQHQHASFFTLARACFLRWDFEVAARYVLAGETFGVSKTMILVW
jgi:hypothetical protein